MPIPALFRAIPAAILVLASSGAWTAARADSGVIRLSVVKGGWFVGASGGRGVLSFHGRQYPISIGGINAGLIFGASRTDLVGRVSNIRRASDVAGTYGAIGAGAAVIYGARVINLRNDKGAVLRMRGRQVGLEAGVDVSGLQISMP